MKRCRVCGRAVFDELERCPHEGCGGALTDAGTFPTTLSEALEEIASIDPAGPYDKQKALSNLPDLAPNLTRERTILKTFFNAVDDTNTGRLLHERQVEAVLSFVSDFVSQTVVDTVREAYGQLAKPGDKGSSNPEEPINTTGQDNAAELAEKDAVTAVGDTTKRGKRVFDQGEYIRVLLTVDPSLWGDDPAQEMEELWRSTLNHATSILNGTGPRGETAKDAVTLLEDALQDSSFPQSLRGEALLSLGRCYESGKGVGRDDKQALRYFVMAAEAGNEEARSIVDEPAKDLLSLARGLEAEGHEDQALRFYLQAAELGNAEAQYFLGICYRYGTGTDEDPGKAHYWLSRAAQQGNKAARAILHAH